MRHTFGSPPSASNVSNTPRCPFCDAINIGVALSCNLGKNNKQNYAFHAKKKFNAVKNDEFAKIVSFEYKVSCLHENLCTFLNCTEFFVIFFCILIECTTILLSFISTYFHRHMNICTKSNQLFNHIDMTSLTCYEQWRSTIL